MDKKTTLEYLPRVAQEAAELSDRIHKLEGFIGSVSNAFSLLDEEQRRLLLEQLAAMKLYRKILLNRVSNMSDNLIRSLSLEVGYDSPRNEVRLPDVAE